MSFKREDYSGLSTGRPYIKPQTLIIPKVFKTQSSISTSSIPQPRYTKNAQIVGSSPLKTETRFRGTSSFPIESGTPRQGYVSTPASTPTSKHVGSSLRASAPASTSPPSYNYNVNDPLNPILLQILDEGINNIVVKFKQALGNTNLQVNQSVFDIIDVLEDLKTSTFNNGNEYKFNNGIVFDPNNKNNNEDAIDIAYKNSNINEKPIDSDNDAYNLDSVNPEYNTIYNTNHQIINTNEKYETLNISNPGDMKTLNNRLLNCQTLEFRYLAKHKELMEVFLFTIDLYKKYEYVIKLVLFLLKFLVNKTGTPLEGTTVDLPKPILRQLPLMLKDQAKVMDVIGAMKETVKNSYAQINKAETSLTDSDRQKFNDDLKNRVKPENFT